MWPNKPRKNRRNRSLPSVAIPPTAEQSQLSLGEGAWGLDAGKTVVEMSIQSPQGAESPTLSEGLVYPLPPYNIGAYAIERCEVTNAGNTLSMRWSGNIPADTAFSWPASQEIRNTSGGIIRPKTGTVVYEE